MSASQVAILGADPGFDNATGRRQRYKQNIARFIRHQPVGSFCTIVLFGLAMTALFANVIAPFDPTQNNVGPQIEGPSGAHYFGTDQFGRDLFSRVVHGARISLGVGFGATICAALIGTTLGTVSGYFGGSVDYIIQRFVDTAQAVPPIILLIGLMIVLGPSITNVVIALALLSGLTTSRVIRGTVLGIRSLTYIEAAKTVGASHGRIMIHHVLPNLLPTVIVLMSLGIGSAIVAEASLSYLGYGVPPPQPTWGGMMSVEGRGAMLLNPWILIFPTIALALVVYSMNMFGDAVRDELDPRLRGSR